MSRQPFMSGFVTGGQPDRLSAMAVTGHDGVMESLERDVTVRVAADQEARFHSLFTQNYEDVLRYCLRRLPGPDANDAASDVFVVAWRRIDAAPAGNDARLWLYGIARNMVRNSRRSARRVVRLRTKVAGLAPETVDGPEHQVVQSDELRHTLVALDRLSPKDQEVLRLRAMERLEIDEIARVLDCSVEAARKRLERAAKRLQSKVGSPVPMKPSLPCESEGEVTA
ncbi:MAG: RNA polymerase sigma factor [Acidimicrobiia bacterium]